MKNFKKNLLGNAELQKALACRGFIFNSLYSGDENYFLFNRNFSREMDLSLVFSIRKPASCSIDLSVSLTKMTKLYYDLGLSLNKPFVSEKDEQAVLSVDLLWLRLNSQPDMLEYYKFDYKYDEAHGVSRILEDIDSVGDRFVSGISNISLLANFLENLDNYKCHISYGGRPISVDPYIYSSLLYILERDYNAASKVLLKGKFAYDVEDPLKWQEIRLRKFQDRSKKIMEYMNQH